MDHEYWNRTLAEIEAWEKHEPGFFEHVGEVIVNHLSRLVNRLPKTWVKVLVDGIAVALKALASVTDNVLGADGVRERVRQETEAHGDTLHGSDEASRFYWKWGVRGAGAEGAGTGVAGAPGLIADIPLLFGMGCAMDSTLILSPSAHLFFT